VNYVQGWRLFGRVDCGVCGLPTQHIELHTDGVRSVHLMKDENKQLRYWSCWSTAQEPNQRESEGPREAGPPKGHR